MQLRRRTVTAVGEGMAAPTSPRVAIKSTASTSARKSKVAAEPRPFLEEDFIAFLYRPHTMLGLLSTVALLAYLAFGRPDASKDENIRTGLVGCAVAFLLYCVLQLRDGMLLRPHPVVWRMVNGVAILYLMLLVFMVMNDVMWLRTQFLPTLFDPTLGTLPETNTKIYASDCRLVTPENPKQGWTNFFDAVFDIFAVAHSLGWWAKAVLFRDYWLLWVLSFSWEVMEVSLQHLLPNFKECWWDHYLLDVFGCNLAGMLLGMWTCRHYANKEFNWTGVKKINSTTGKLKRVLNQFTPFSWTNYEWAAFKSVKRLLQVTAMLAFVELCELNAFFLKHALWIPPPCPLNTMRLLVLGMLSFPALREWYAYIDSPDCKRMGSSLWLMVAIGAVETLAVVKWIRQDPGMFTYPVGMKDPTPTPETVGKAWVISTSLFVLWMAIHFGLPSQWRQQHQLIARSLDGLLVASISPLVYLAAVDFLDTWSH